MISGRLPQDVDSWPEGLLEHLASFEQGHLIADLPWFYFADPANAVLLGTIDPDSDPLFWHEEEFPYGVIVSQTCDLQEVGARRPRKPWIHCCPVYRADLPESGLSASLLGQVRKGEVEYLIEVPDVPAAGVWVADLRLLIPVEKSHLLGRQPIDGFPNERARRAVGERMAMLHSRPAFDGVFVELVQDPLMKRLRELAKQDIELYAQVVNEVYAMGVRADRLASMGLESIEIFLLCHNEPGEAARAFWESESEAWAQEALRSSECRLQELRVVLLQEMSAKDFLELQVVPLRGMTPHPLWHVD